MTEHQRHLWLTRLTWWLILACVAATSTQGLVSVGVPTLVAACVCLPGAVFLCVRAIEGARYHRRIWW